MIDSILSDFDPESIVAVDRAEGFVAAAKKRIVDSRVPFEMGDAMALTWPDESCDVIVSGLVLNFVSDAAACSPYRWLQTLRIQTLDGQQYGPVV